MSVAPRPGAASDALVEQIAAAQTPGDLGELLRALQRRQARSTNAAPMSYRQIAARTGWSHGIVGEYFAGNVVPPAPRFDELARLLGAQGRELGALATVRDRVEEAERARRGEASASRTLLCALPPRRTRLIARERDLAELDAVAGRRDDEPQVALVVGPAGAGKSALAVEWARANGASFPDGQLFVNLRGFDANGVPADPADALVQLLGALGVSARSMPASVGERSALLRERLAGKRLLLILDNASDEEQVRPLLPSTPGTMTVVTSRLRLLGLVAVDHAVPVAVGHLDETASRALLVDRLGAGRTDADPGAVAQVLAACAGLPLALTLVAARAALTPDGTLSVAALHPARDLTPVVSWTLARVSDLARRTFHRLGLHPGGVVSTGQAGALAALSTRECRAALQELDDACLVEPAGPEAWTLHDLVRSCAGNLADADPASDNVEAARRLTEQVTLTAWRASQLIDAYPDFPPPETAADVESDPLTDLAAAADWFATFAPVMRQLLTESDDAAAAVLGSVFGHYLFWVGTSEDALRVQTQAAELLLTAGDVRTAVTNLRYAAYSLHKLDRVEESWAMFDRALALAGDDHRGIARLEYDRAHVEVARGLIDVAEQRMIRGMAAADESGDATIRGRLRNSLAYLLAQAGRTDDAERWAVEAVEILQDAARTPSDTTLGSTLDTLGYLRLRQGRLDEARDAFQRAAAHLVDPGLAFIVHDHLAEALSASGDAQGAAEARLRSSELQRQIGGAGGRML